MDVARGARDGTDEGGAQDMRGGGPQGESSGSPDERPAGCVGLADTEHGPANTGDDGSDGGGGIAGEGTLGVARATGHPKTPVAAASFGARQVSAPEEGGWSEIARSEWPEGIEEAPAVATARRKGGRRCVLVSEGGRRYRVRLGVAGIRVFAQ